MLGDKGSEQAWSMTPGSEAKPASRESRDRTGRMNRRITGSQSLLTIEGGVDEDISIVVNNGGAKFITIGASILTHF
ncbi:hypothetical protein TIFTF001_051835 [Ficus carica]|uniref:Uncharacterized protein n=1 Tax=Ficus carica TaxID=3494 RepID=A0AA88JEZ4_FICCA|nr:hypothetical protein TIFTF001_051835 [Ficus carica]